jgi:hypothetical protein
MDFVRSDKKMVLLLRAGEMNWRYHGISRLRASGQCNANGRFGCVVDTLGL